MSGKTALLIVRYMFWNGIYDGLEDLILIAAGSLRREIANLHIRIEDESDGTILTIGDTIGALVENAK